VLLSHVAPHVAPQPQQTLGAEHLDSIETLSNNWSVEGAGCSRNVSGEAGIANYRYFESPKFAEIARPGPRHGTWKRGGLLPARRPILCALTIGLDGRPLSSRTFSTFWKG
jgi:hypothetical protein